MKSPLLAILAAVGSFGAPVHLPAAYRPPRRRPDLARAAPVSPEAEARSYERRVWRHRFTGQRRSVWLVQRGLVFWIQARGHKVRNLRPTPAWKAVRWLRNAEPETRR